MYKHTVPNSYGHGSTLLAYNCTCTWGTPCIAMKTFTAKTLTNERLFGNRTRLFVCSCAQRPSTLTISACVRARARSAALCMDKPAGTFF